MTTAILDALVFAVSALVISLTGKRLALVNLAAGEWLLCGGWLAAYALEAQGGSAPLDPRWFGALALAAAVQIGAVRLAGGRFVERPVLYLLLSLGISLVVGGVLQWKLLRMATAPITVELESQWIVVGGLGLVAGTVFLVLNSRQWTRLALTAPVAAKLHITWPWWSLAGLAALEVLLLVVLGMATFPIHRGIASSGEMRSVIPVLSLVATGYRPMQAACLAFLIAIGTHGLTLAPYPVGSMAMPICLAILVVATVWLRMPRRPIVSARVMRSPRAIALPAEQRTLASARGAVGTRGSLARLGTVGNAATHALLVVSLILVLRFSPDQAGAYAGFVACLATIAWIGHVVLGVESVAWPLAAASLGLVWMAGDLSWGAAVLLVPLLALAWGGYLLMLRCLRRDASVLVDLGATLCVVEVVRRGPWVLGPNDIRMLSDITGSQISPLASIGSTFAILGCVSWCLFLANRGRGRARSMLIGLANFANGLQHGRGVVLSFVGVGALLWMLATAAFGGYHLSHPAITEKDIALLIGLSVLIFASTADIAGLGAVVTGIVGLYAILGSQLAGLGAGYGLVVGLALVTMALFGSLARSSADAA